MGPSDDEGTPTKSDGTDRAAGRPLGIRIGLAITRFETLINVIALLLLVAAAVLVIAGGSEAVIDAVTSKLSALDGGMVLLDRILLVLIIAELAYTLRTVIESHEIAAEPFLFIGLIAAVRRILIVTARLDQPQPQSSEQLDRLLIELGMLALLVLAIAAAIMMIRFGGSRLARSRPTDGQCLWIHGAPRRM